MKEIKIVTGKNAVLLEKELQGYFQEGFSPWGNIVHNPADGLVLMVARDLKQVQPEKEHETPAMEKVED